MPPETTSGASSTSPDSGVTGAERQPPGTDQDAVLGFLGDPATHGGLIPRRIDTHAASVFLAGDRALKLKRAVHFPYLDYSTLARRKAACEAELTINRRFAPALYERVMAITRDATGRLALDGGGTPLDYVVSMRRFDEMQTLDHVARRHGITAALADTLGRMVAEAHAQAPVTQDGTRWIAELPRYIAQDERDLTAEPTLFDPARATALVVALRTALTRIGPLLTARAREGFVRQGHGDMHLANIALIDGAPTLFDAIEFDPLIAAGDVLYDLAFLLMDLMAKSERDAANGVLNRYLVAAGATCNLDALAALPLFMALRALIRARVALARLSRARHHCSPATANEVRAYFELAGELIAPPPPHVLAIGGLSGTGKSAAARRIAPELGAAPGAVILRSDVIRKAMNGVGETTRLPPAAYTREATAAVYARLVDDTQRCARAGHACIVDAVLAQPDERAALHDAARAAGVTFTGVILKADLETRLARIAGRSGDASDADAAVAQGQAIQGNLDDGWQEIGAEGDCAQTAARLRAAVVARGHL